MDRTTTGRGSSIDGSFAHLKEDWISPQRTLRVVLYMNEENGQRGAAKYTEVAKRKKRNTFLPWNRMLVGLVHVVFHRYHS